MNKQELDNATPEQRQRNQIEGIAGIVALYADLIKTGVILVDPDTLHGDGDEGIFSFHYKLA